MAGRFWRSNLNGVQLLGFMFVEENRRFARSHVIIIFDDGERIDAIAEERRERTTDNGVFTRRYRSAPPSDELLVRAALLDII
jgi:hypothetical protein